MFTEVDFQAALDAEPDNHFLREVFADWLDEQGDPRAAGYRALGKNGKFTYALYDYFTYADYKVEGQPDESDLPHDWFSIVAAECGSVTPTKKGVWANWKTRRMADDAAALAFSRLSAARQAELLQCELVSS
jgi:uncharacterized protein (TIGR02996 family)